MGINIKINKAETPALALLIVSGGDKPMGALLHGNPLRTRTAAPGWDAQGRRWGTGWVRLHGEGHPGVLLRNE